MVSLDGESNSVSYDGEENEFVDELSSSSPESFEDDQHYGEDDANTGNVATGKNTPSEGGMNDKSMKKSSKQSTMSSRLFHLAMSLICCASIAALVLYFVGVGPFEGVQTASKALENDGGTSVPSHAPSVHPSQSQAPSVLVVPSNSSDPRPFEFDVMPNYQAIVPKGTTNETTGDISGGLIDIMDELALDELKQYMDRNAESCSIQLPTTIESIEFIDCPLPVATDLGCVDVIAKVVLLCESEAGFVEEYQAALESEIESIVFDAEAESPVPTDSLNGTSTPSTSPTIGTMVSTSTPTTAPSNATTFEPTNVTTSSPTPFPTIATTFLPTVASTNMTTMVPTTSTTTMPTESPIRFFVIAGDSNVVGYADLNHLVSLSFTDPSYSKFVTPFFSPVERPDAFVMFNNDYESFKIKAEGMLSTLYGVDGGHFGPEVGFGWDLADIYDENVVVVKAGGAGALANQWLPPSSGGPGSYYTQLINDIWDATTRADEITGSTGRPVEFAGFIWFHGYDDVINSDFISAYETNLQNLITDIRTEFELPYLPIVVAELGTQGMIPDESELEMREIQRRVVDANEYTILSNTSQFVAGFDTTVSSEIYDAASKYWGRADVMVSIGYQFAADVLLAKTTGSGDGASVPTDEIIL